MATKTTGKGSSAMSIYQQLKEEILSLCLEPGSMIDESSIAGRFGVSRSPVREAFIRLAADGLIKTLPNKSSQVAPLEIEDFPGFIDALELIQRAVLRLAAVNRSDAELAQITAQNALYLDAVAKQDIKAMINLNYQFHVAISDAAKNKHFAHIYQRLLNQGRRTLRIYYRAFDDAPPQSGVDSHQQIIQALHARDPERADKLAQEHTMQLRAGILRFLSERKTATMML